MKCASLYKIKTIKSIDYVSLQQQQTKLVTGSLQCRTLQPGNRVDKNCLKKINNRWQGYKANVNQYIYNIPSRFKHYFVWMMMMMIWQQNDEYRKLFDSLPPNDIYICRTAPLTSRRCILNIYSTNIRTEYFKHTALSLFFLKCRLLHNATLFGSCIIHILNPGCAKI
jgi:hypothetical protein